MGGRQGPQRLPSDSFSPLSTYRAHRTSSSCSRCLTFGGWIKHLADWIRSPSFSSLLIDSRTAGRLLIDDFVSGIICAGRLLSHSPGSVKPEKRGKPKRRMGSATERARHIHLALSRRVSFFLRRKKKTIPLATVILRRCDSAVSRLPVPLWRPLHRQRFAFRDVFYQIADDERIHLCQLLFSRARVLFFLRVGRDRLDDG